MLFRTDGMSSLVVICLTAATVGNLPAAEADTATTGQQICLPETDPSSPRKAALKAQSPDDEIIRTDLDSDGDPDILETWLNGKRTRWFDENDDMRATDVTGDRVADSVQIDRDNDGYYDGPDDINVDYVDGDADGRPELEVVAMNPNSTQRSIYSGASHYMIFEDVDGDGVFGCLNWQTFAFDCWGIDETDPNFKPDYNGDSVFLKEHAPAWAIVDPRYNWENPFIFYDWDNDGVSEQAVRYLDTKIRTDDETTQTYSYDGMIDEVFTSWDLDNDSGHNNELDFDMTIRMTGGEEMDYKSFVQKHPTLPAPDWVLPYFRYTNWRKIDELIYVPHGAAIEEMFKPRWADCWLTFDEDDDDHRWERTELYYPEKDGIKSDPYIVKKWDRDEKTTEGISSHPQADTLGDRGEWDMDFSGEHQMYVGRWDGKIHLYGADWGAWTVDRGGKYWGGAGPARGTASPKKAPKVQEVVVYADNDKDGFIDEITFDYDGDRTIDLTVNLLKLGGADADKADLFDPAVEKWQGMGDRYKNMIHKSWSDAILVYQAAWKIGMTDKEMEDLSVASSVAEKYDKAYWLRETVFRRLYEKLAGNEDARQELMRVHFLGDAREMAEFVGKQTL